MAFLGLTVALFALAPSNRYQRFETRILLSTTAATNVPQKYANLLDWLTSQGAEINHALEIQESSHGGGYGAVVTDPVKADELLITIPRKACVTLQNVRDDVKCGDAFQELIKKAGPGANTVCMAGWVAKEYLMMQEKEDDSSLFGPYLATLPWKRGINNQEHTLYWSDEDIELLLKGSLSYQEAKEIRGEVKLAASVLEGIIGPSILEYRGETDESGANFSWPWEKKQPNEPIEGLVEALNGAFVSILSRGFQDGESGDEEKLVPLLDMLQHSDEPNVRHAMSKDDGTVEVRARRDLVAGEELLNQYRSEAEEKMPYHRFFTRYGFVPGIMEPIPNLLRDKSPIFFAQKAEV
jgi:hypothetical protein